jgi:DNA-directed RNA polymerase subunit K/omega
LLLSKATATTMTKQTVHLSLNVIPDDPEGSLYRFVIVSALRARQLQGGARSVLLPVTTKPTIVAMQEVRRGLIAWSNGAAPLIALPAKIDSI